jgi:hypothetical protein
MQTKEVKSGKGFKITTDLGDGNQIVTVMKADLKGIAYTQAIGTKFEKGHQNKGLVFLSQVVKELLGLEVDLNAERKAAIQRLRQADQSAIVADELASMAH